MNFSEETIESHTKLFYDFWSSCDKLPKNAFRNETNKFVISLFDSVFVTVCEKIKNEGLNDIKITQESLVKLKEDREFNSLSQGSTASATSVASRLERARAIIVLQ